MILLALLACTPTPPVPLLETGWFHSDTGVEACAHQIVVTEPAAHTVDWYWRAPLVVRTTSTEDAEYQTFLIDPHGNRVEVERIWSADSPRFSLRPSEPLHASVSYTLRVVDCLGTRDIPFQTSALGEPLHSIDVLKDKAYHIDLQSATWVEPGGIAPLLTLYFTSQGLIDAPIATESELQLRFALGYYTTTGQLRQSLSQSTSRFPVVNFASHPFFSATAPEVSLDFSGVPIPIYDFYFEGTFSADGDTIGGGKVYGVGDTRYAGVLVNDDRPGAVCELGAGLGVQCGMCPSDNLPYCLPVSMEDVVGRVVDGLQLQER